MATGVVDFSDLETQRNPFEAYRQLHRQGPVYRDPGTGFFVVTDYDMLRDVARNPSLFSNDNGVILIRSGELGKKIRAMQEEHGIPSVSVLLTTDPPAHTYHRAFVDKAFSPARVKQLEEYLKGVCEDLLDRLDGRDEIDFVADVCVQIPVLVVADLLGVDRSRAGDIKRWTDATARASDPTLDDETMLELLKVACGLELFIRELAQKYRLEPNDSLLSTVANMTVDGRPLTDPELVSLMRQVFVAGHETTTNTMAGAMMWMINVPGLEARLRNEPQLIELFVEEVLRLEAPLQAMFRRATADTVLGDVEIPAGSVIVMRWGAGNRDPKRFPDPDSLDLTRRNVRNHLAFGTGIHFCVGNQLARAELRIAITALLKRFCNFRYVDGENSIERSPHYFQYGISKLLIGFYRISN
jgi:cytochrome P450